MQVEDLSTPVGLFRPPPTLIRLSPMNDLEARARRFSDERHARSGDTRKFTGDAYIAHPAAVAELVRSADHTPEMLAAAWLHDLVEHDCATPEEIETQFGPDVRRLVQMLTPISKESDGSRAQRKQIDRNYLSHASPDAMTIKLADMIDNVSSVVERDPKFARVYLPEKLADLQVLVEGDARLFEMARLTIERAMSSLQTMQPCARPMPMQVSGSPR